jgi:hypothetical protein
LASASRFGVTLSFTPYLPELGRKSSETRNKTFLAPGGAGGGGGTGAGARTRAQGLQLSPLSAHSLMLSALDLRWQAFLGS